MSPERMMVTTTHSYTRGECNVTRVTIGDTMKYVTMAFGVASILVGLHNAFLAYLGLGGAGLIAVAMITLGLIAWQTK